MSAIHDRKFLDLFSLTVGVLVGIVVAIYLLANWVAGRTEPSGVENPEYQALVAERIASPVRVAVAGQDNSALAIVADKRSQQTSGAAAIPTNGAEVYEQVCAVCHSQGVGGAPRMDDAAAWAPRIAKGKNTLYMHALEGFQGIAGVMPPKGGRTDLSDDLVRSAVDHMLEMKR